MFKFSTLKRTTRFDCCAVNHKRPSGPNVGVCGSRAVCVLNSRKRPVCGSSRPILPAEFSVNQMLPLLSATRPVYQPRPAGSTAGSCGSDPGVGTTYSVMRPVRAPEAAKARLSARATIGNLECEILAMLRSHNRCSMQSSFTRRALNSGESIQRKKLAENLFRRAGESRRAQRAPAGREHPPHHEGAAALPVSVALRRAEVLFPLTAFRRVPIHLVAAPKALDDAVDHA